MTETLKFAKDGPYCFPRSDGLANPMWTRALYLSVVSWMEQWYRLVQPSLSFAYRQISARSGVATDRSNHILYVTFFVEQGECGGVVHGIQLFQYRKILLLFFAMHFAQHTHIGKIVPILNDLHAWQNHV